MVPSADCLTAGGFGAGDVGWDVDWGDADCAQAGTPWLSPNSTSTLATASPALAGAFPRRIIARSLSCRIPANATLPRPRSHNPDADLPHRRTARQAIPE
jgi:hypothetical protein